LPDRGPRGHASRRHDRGGGHPGRHPGLVEPRRAAVHPGGCRGHRLAALSTHPPLDRQRKERPGMRRSVVDLAVGVFVLVGVLALAWLSINLGRIDLLGSHGYVLTADFPSVGGLKVGSSVEIAGVEIGRVDSITLDKDFQARVRMTIRPDVKLQDDSIASIKTKG